MQNEQTNDSEFSNREDEEEEEEEVVAEDPESQNHECDHGDNAWRSMSTAEHVQRWRTEKHRYDEFIEYIREVDEILNLIKPFPREGEEEEEEKSTRVTETGRREIVRSDSREKSPRFGLNHLENIIKLVEQLKELQESESRLGERACCLKDLRKLREHKKRLKNQELEFRNRVRYWNLVTGDDVGEFKVEFPEDLTSEPSSPTYKTKPKKPEMVTPNKEKWQDKRKSLTLSQKVNFSESKSKISKWTKVKEAFHWERTSSVISKPVKKEVPGGNAEEEGNGGVLDGNSLESGESYRDHSPEVGFLDGCSPADLPPPPPSPPRIHSSHQPKSEDLLSVRPVQDFPSSSSSDKMDEVGSYSEVLTKENKSPDTEFPSQLFPGDDNEDAESRTRKSSSEELMQFPQHLCKDDSRLGKSNKTTWGKVKDIIQTRKDSLKKKPKKRGSEEFKKRRKLSLPASQFSADQFEDLSSPEEKFKNVMESVTSKSISELSERPSTSIQSKGEDKPMKKHPPSLTITVPSTEELRNFPCDMGERRDVAEDRMNILSHFSCQAQYCEDKSKYGKTKSGQNQRMSRWVKVKRVFLTSTSPPSPSQCVPKANLSPGSQNKSSGFFSDMESDEVSSSEWIDDKLNSPDKVKTSGDIDLQPVVTTFIHEDVRKSYRELQKKLSHEFEQKLREWEMKSEGFAKSEDFPQKSRPEDGDSIPKFRKTRDSIPVPLPNLNDLSPEFKKKLSDWKKMKTSQSTPSVSGTTAKEEIQSQNIKIRIGEWQPWRSRYLQKASGLGKCDQSPGEDYSKKPEDGQKTGSGGGGGGGLRPPCNRRKEEEGSGTGGSLTGKRDSKRRDSIKKITHSRLSSGGESLASASSTDREEKSIKRSQKVKDFHWVEKELQKIEREKLRLEQEREKYLEREARLEQMKRTMETTSPAQEILVRTPTGVFRFKGISQKFTKKLYEWEKARGIAPEASTFALLEESVKADPNEDSESSDSGTTLQRSKSMGSVPEMTSSLLIETMAHHPSSLSLNDVEDLKILDKTDNMDDSIASEQMKIRKDAEPEAIIVDVEDVVEETALLADTLLSSYQSEIPIYTFTSEEVHRLTDSVQRSSSTEYRDSEEKKSRIDQSERRLQLFEASTGKESIYRKAEERLERDIEMRKTDKEDEEGTIRKDTQLKDGNDQRKPFLQYLSPIPLILEPEHELHVLKTETEDSGTKDSSTGTSEYKSHFHKVETRSNNDLTRAKPDSEVLKKKIKEKITLMQRISTEGKPHSWKPLDSDQTNKKDESSSQPVEEIKVVAGEFSSRHNHQEPTRSVNVFVPTTRKIISPVQTNQGTTPSVFSYVIDDVKSEEPLQEGLQNVTSVGFDSESSHHQKGGETTRRIPCDEVNSRRGCQPMDDESEKIKSRNVGSFLPLPQQNLTPSFQEKKKSKSETNPESDRKRDIGIPPLPNSPKAYRKLNTKETAPSIRMIIAKYNQKISEHETPVEKRGESASPTIWRSPVFGRRTQEKIEKYFKKNEGEVQKSASYDNVTSIRSASTATAPQDNQISSPKGILKSSSMGIMKNQNFEADSSNNNSSLSLDVKGSEGSETTKQSSPSVLRALRIQKAKEDFLSGRLSVSSDTSPTTPTENPIGKSADVQSAKTQVDGKMSETGKVEHVTLGKSVSAETITSEKNEAQNENLPDSSLDGRTLQKSSSKFDISTIKSKFRKIRMRKDKESKVSAVSVLCRQSLLIELPKDSEKSHQADSSMSKSCPSSPVMDRNKLEKPEEVKPSAGSSAGKRKET